LLLVSCPAWLQEAHQHTAPEKLGKVVAHIARMGADQESGQISNEKTEKRKEIW
jgi:hypothetical protein